MNRLPSSSSITFLVIMILNTIIISLLSLSTSSSQTVSARTVYRGNWTEFYIFPSAGAGYGDVTFLFVPADDRGAGTILYVHQQAGALYGAPVDGYRYGRETPRDEGKNISGILLTKMSGPGESVICPAWYTPPPVYDSVVESLSNPLNNQTVFTPNFRLLGNSLQLDDQNRLVIHSNILQILVRLEATASDLRGTVISNQPPSNSPHTGNHHLNGVVKGNFITSLLWGAWCNGTHLPFTNRPYTPSTDPPASGALTLVQFLERYSTNIPKFLPDGGIIFGASTFQCVFYSGPATNWMVTWWIGNCSADPFIEKKIYPRVSVRRQDSVCAAPTSILVHYPSRKVYLADRTSTIREIDLVTDMVRLIAGNSSNFIPRPIQGCDLQTRCTPFKQQISVTNQMSVVSNVASSIDGESTTILYIIDSLFQSLYSIDIRNEVLFTELTEYYDPSKPYSPNECTPSQIAAAKSDVFVLCRDGSTIRRKKLLPMDPPPEPVVALPTLDEVSITTVTAITTLTGIIGVPTIAVTAGRVRALMSLARCDVTMPRGEPLDWTESPTQLSIGDSDFRYYSGAIIGNLAIVLIVPFLAHFLIVRVLFWRNNKKKQDARRKELMNAVMKQQQRNSNSNSSRDTTPNNNTSNNRDSGNNNNNNNDLSSPFIKSDAFGDDDDQGTANLLGSSHHHGHSDAKTPERMLLEAEATLRYPSASLLFAIMFTLEPTVRCAAYLMRFADPKHPDNLKTSDDNPANLHTKSDFAIGITGFIISCISMIGISFFFAYKFTAVFYPKEDFIDALLKNDADYVNDPNIISGGRDGDGNNNQRVEVGEGLTARQILFDLPSSEDITFFARIRLIIRLWYSKWKTFSKPYGEWRDHRNEQPRRFGGLIKPYVDRGRWWAVCELFSAAVLAALSGFKTRETCVTIAAVAVPILWAFFVGMIVIRPMASPFDNVLQSLIAGLSAFSGLFLLAAAVPFSSAPDFVRSCFSLAETLALAAAFLVGIDALIDVTERFFKLVKFLTTRWCPSTEEDLLAKQKLVIAGGSGSKSTETINSADFNFSLPNTNSSGTTPIVIDSLNSDSNSTPRSSSKQQKRSSSSNGIPTAAAVMRIDNNGSSNSSGNNTGSSTARTASSDMDLFEAVQRHIAKSSKKQQKHHQRQLMTRAGGAADATPSATDKNGFLVPPTMSGMIRSSSGGSSSSSLATMIRQSTGTSSSTGRNSSDSSFIRNYINDNSNSTKKEEENNSNSKGYTDYKLDDDDDDDFTHGKQINSADDMFTPKSNGDDEDSEERRKRRRDRELMEHEILRAKLKQELDTGEANNEEEAAEQEYQQGGGYENI